MILEYLRLDPTTLFVNDNMHWREGGAVAPILICRDNKVGFSRLGNSFDDLFE